MSSRPIVRYQEIEGKTYEECWQMQTALHDELKDNKVAVRRGEREPSRVLHHLLFCEHHHVYTLGKSGSVDHLLLSDDELRSGAIEFFKINRGGDITYHGPGQITGYPIFDLDEFYTDVHRYVRALEEVVIRLLQSYDIQGSREAGYTGVWIAPDERRPQKRKICAIGVHLSRWVTMHGFALNVNTDLSYFGKIIPCGISDEDKAVTSLQSELGQKMDLAEVRLRLKRIFAEIFEYEYERKASK